jgi:hypothetical protein
MARGRSTEDIATLQMALVGYQIEKQRIESKIQEIRSQLKGRAGASTSTGGEAAAPRKRELSEAARKRIAMAQKRRWAEHRKRAAAAKSQSGKPQAAKAGGAGSAA